MDPTPPQVPQSFQSVPPGSVEPHAGFLSVPKADQFLYKMMTVENLLRSQDGRIHGLRCAEE